MLASVERRLLLQNNYNTDFIRRNTHRVTDTTETNRDSTSITTTAAIPYIKGTSEAIARILQPYNIRVAHRPITTLRHLLTNVKDKDEPNNRQGAIYKIECSDCQASYIGETGRNLNTRLTEHKRATRKFHSSNKIRFSSLLLRIHLLSKITHINCCSNVKNWIAKYDLSSVRNVEPNTWHQLS